MLILNHNIQFKNLLDEISFFKSRQRSQLSFLENSLKRMPVASSLRSFSQPSIDEDPYLLERHKMQNKQLEAKYEELVDQIYFMKKQNNRFSEEIVKIDQHLDNFRILSSQIEGDRARAEKDYVFYERKIDDLLFKKKYIMRIKQKKIDHETEKQNIEKQMAEESMHKKYNATQKNIHLLKEISFLKSQKKVSLDKMNHVQNLSYAKDLIFIMGQLFLKGEISFYIDSSLYLSKTDFSRIVANLDLSILFQLLPDPESLIEHILNDYSKFDEDYNLQAISAHLIDKYHEMNARSEQLLKHAQQMLSDLGHLRDHSKKPHYIEQAKTPIHMTIEQLESEIAQYHLENGHIMILTAEVCKLQVRLFSTILLSGKRTIQLVTSLQQMQQSEHSDPIVLTVQEMKQLIEEIIVENRDLVADLEELKESFVTIPEKQKKQYEYFKEYLEQQKASFENSNNFISISQELFPHWTKKQQQAQILIFLKQVQWEQNSKIKKMQMKMARQYEMSKPYKMEIILSHLGNVDGNFKESLENVLANPLVQVFLKLDRIIDLASSVDFDSFRLFTTVAEETMRNYLEFHRKYFELTRALFSCLRKLKPASSSWQSWKSERRKLNELTERMRIYSYRDRRQNSPEDSSQQVMKNERGDRSISPEQQEFEKPLERFLFEKVKRINTLFLSKEHSSLMPRESEIVKDQQKRDGFVDFLVETSASRMLRSD